MVELAAVAISFPCMLYMLHKKVNFSLAMIVTSAMICLIAGLGPGGFIQAVVNTFSSYKTFETGMTVFMISVLGGVCRRYGILERIVESLGKLIRNPKAVLMLIPAVVGLLAVPGGAIMSVPFIDELGDRVQLTGQRKAVINLVFRHVGSMLMPYSTNILLVGTIFPQINIYHLILLNCGFFVVNVTLGYWFFVRDIQVKKNERTQRPVAELGRLLLYASPIYACVLLNLMFGLPFYWGVAFSLVIVYFLSDRKNYIPNLIKSININITLTILSVLLLQNTIQSLSKLLAMFTGALGTGNAAIFVLAGGSIFLGVISGLSLTPMGIMLPMVALLNLPMGQLLTYVHFLFCCAYLGYFFSPLHPCQVFTLEYLKLKSGLLYKEYRYYALFLTVGTALLFVVYSFLLH